MIDAVYFEMIKKDEALKSLDDEINSIGKRSNELILQKQELLYEPSKYFGEVAQKITSVKDSILKKEMQDFIKESSDNFERKKKDLELVIKQIEFNNIKINDYYDFFKIKTTLPEIEKYQNQNPLKLEELNKMISDQTQLVEKLKNVK